MTRTIANHVENLTLLGSANIDGTGNSLVNVIVGNAAINMLNGMTGADRLAGLGGNDIYFVDNVGDVVAEAANQGTDTIRSTISRTLPGNVENLILFTGAAIRGNGNDLNNTITANSADNVLYGVGGADTINGADGNDIIVGGNGNDSIAGGTGRDIITGGLGSATMIGGLGNDAFVLTAPGDTSFSSGDVIDGTVEAGTVDTLVLATAGNYNLANSSVRNIDLVTLTQNAAGYNIGLSSNLMLGTANSQQLVIAPAVTMTHGIYVSALLATAGSIRIDGVRLNGDDDFVGGSGNDILMSGAGNDDIIGDEGDDTLDGGNGNDVLWGWTGDDTLSGGAGNDNFLGWSGDDSINGGAGDDIVHGGDDDDTIDGGASNDTITGGIGDDTINGGAGDDTITSGTGKDTLIGGTGSDTFVVTAADDGFNGSILFQDTIDGTAEAVTTDTIVLATADAYYLRSIKNIDRVVLAQNGTYDVDISYLMAATANSGQLVITASVSMTTQVTLRGPGLGPNGETASIYVDGVNFNSSDAFQGGSGDDFLNSGPGGDVIFDIGGNNTLAGGDGGDTIIADVGVDLIFGDGGSDFLRGEAGNDTINGGGDFDTIDGREGADTLTGGADGDQFRYLEIGYSNEGAAGRDTITDMSSDDRLDLSSALTGSKAAILNKGDGAYLGSTLDFFDDGSIDRAVAVQTNAAAGTTRMYADYNNDGNYTVGADLVVEFTGNVSAVLLDTTKYMF